MWHGARAALSEWENGWQAVILYSQLLDAVVADLTRKISLFEHIDPERIIVVAANRVTHGPVGALAECVALNLPETPAIAFRYDPRARRLTGASPWFIPKNRRVIIHGKRMLYVLRFRLPRFMNLNPARSVIHELLHIADRFDGTHRALRHGVWFERYVRSIEREWRRCGDPRLIEILDLNFRDLQREYGSIVCRCFHTEFRTPWRLPCEKPSCLAQHPEVQRLGLSLPPGQLPRLQFKFDDPEKLRLTERNLEYRVFTPQCSQRIAAELLPPSAINQRITYRWRSNVYVRYEKTEK